jgi:hypothetical protein
MTTLKGGDNRYTASVDNTNRLLTRTVARDDAVDAGVRGDAYFILVPEITLTTDNPSAVYVYQNDEDRDIILKASITSADVSVGGASQVYQSFRVSGPGMTMADGLGVPVPVANVIFGSNKTLANTSELGQEGATIIGGGPTSPLFFPTGTAQVNEVFIIIPKGVAIGGLITPPVGNTSMGVVLLIEVYLREASAI